MPFQVLTKEKAAEFMGAKRQSSPRGEVTKYVEYVEQVVRDDIAGMIEIRGEMPNGGEGATQKEISSRANVEVSRIKSAAKAANVDLIVVKRGDKVIFRPADAGETPNAGPNAPERQARAPRNGTLADAQAADADDEDGEDEEDEEEDEESDEEATGQEPVGANTAEDAITGGGRRRR